MGQVYRTCISDAVSEEQDKISKKCVDEGRDLLKTLASVQGKDDEGTEVTVAD